ncbi:hypothetical protein CIHG_06369 [Coccidioides immitis H538.4]|uniref:Aminoglycoside phosphotransferase domain-containing protein n=1 Tax=Coccidioides immitis H538.4 TaxID=396776 RepID=A0A0J8RWS1_COCIT|nr:hypothetical protein CIHG_06369 [Coccidioides immitis H538.4]
MAIPHVINENRIRGPFYLCHLDPHFGNMLFDDDFNLTGVWTRAQRSHALSADVTLDYTSPVYQQKQKDQISSLRSSSFGLCKRKEQSQAWSMVIKRRTLSAPPRCLNSCLPFALKLRTSVHTALHTRSPGMENPAKPVCGYRRDTHHTLSLQSKLEISIKEAVEFSPRTQSGGQPKWVDRWIASNVLVSVQEYGMEEFMPDQ